jgi:hypothetical protein
VEKYLLLVGKIMYLLLVGKIMYLLLVEKYLLWWRRWRPRWWNRLF